MRQEFRSMLSARRRDLPFFSYSIGRMRQQRASSGSKGPKREFLSHLGQNVGKSCRATELGSVDVSCRSASRGLAEGREIEGPNIPAAGQTMCSRPPMQSGTHRRSPCRPDMPIQSTPPSLMDISSSRTRSLPTNVVAASSGLCISTG